MLPLFLPPAGALAEDVAISGATTAWIPTCSLLEFFMSLPGLALFYGGLVRSKNVLAVLMQIEARPVYGWRRTKRLRNWISRSTRREARSVLTVSASVSGSA